MTWNLETIINNDGMSIRKALKYYGCSKKKYYCNKDHRYDIDPAVTAVTAVLPSTTMIEKKYKKSPWKDQLMVPQEWLQC